MQHLLCHPRFQQFFDRLQEDPTDLAAMTDALKESVGALADLLSIGRLTLSASTSQSPLDRQGQAFTVDLVAAAPFRTDALHTEHFLVDGKATLTLTYAPKAHHVWTDSDKAALHFLGQHIFLYCKRARTAQLLERVGLVDMLTGVENTRGFLQHGGKLYLQEALSQYVCLFLNLKNFNSINQHAGLPQGDEILRRYAQMIQEYLEGEEIIARLGGDNFAVLIRSQRVQAFLDFLSHISITVTTVQNTVRTFEIRSRAAISTIAKDQILGDVLTQVSITLHQMKTAGLEDYAWFQPQMLSEALRRKEVSLLFPHALAQREFSVYYQPKVTLADNRLCGCEALVRWVHDGTIVPPMEFIPVLEKEGSVCLLDFYVLETVCSDIRKWLEQGIEPVCVSVNLSKMHLRSEHLADTIIETLEKYGIDSKYLEVELTEMSGYENYANLAAFVGKMKAHGIRTSIDDFGTGYSSLNLLKELDVDIIKLDKSFLDDTTRQHENGMIVVTNIVKMVNELHMEVIAEGVETPFQAEFLQSIHCGMAQGYLFDRPLPHDDFQRRLCNQQPYQIA